MIIANLFSAQNDALTFGPNSGTPSPRSDWCTPDFMTLSDPVGSDHIACSSTLLLSTSFTGRSIVSRSPIPHVPSPIPP